MWVWAQDAGGPRKLYVQLTYAWVREGVHVWVHVCGCAGVGVAECTHSCAPQAYHAIPVQAGGARGLKPPGHPPRVGVQGIDVLRVPCAHTWMC